MALPTMFKGLNLFLDGVGFQGKIEEFQNPVLTLKTDEYQGGGMGMPVDIEMGLEKLTSDVTFGGFMPELAKKFGNCGLRGVSMRARGWYENEETCTPTTVELVLEGRMTEMDIGTWKRGDKAPFKAKLTWSYYKLRVNGSDVFEMDAEWPVPVVNGDRSRLTSAQASLG